MKKLIFLIIFFYEFSYSEDHSAIALMYHRFDDPKHQSTSISSELFEKHLNLIKESGFNVLNLKDFLDILINKKKIPEKILLITVDDAFRSFYNFGFPLLKKYNFPFSVFVSTASVSEDEESDFMSWEMLREIQKHKGMVLNHTVDHISLVELSDRMIVDQVIKASNEIKLKLGTENPKIVSYPYGESSERVEKILEGLGILAAFSQHSAPMNHDDLILRLPRFSLNDHYGTLDRLKMIFRTKRLPIKNLTFTDSIAHDEDIEISFQSSINVEKINCYINQGVNLIKKINDNEVKLELKGLKSGQRHRLNCTIINNEIIYWFGKMIKRVN